MKEIWAEKHRPKNLESFVGQTHLKDEFIAICRDGAPMQNYLFHSYGAGTGKTSLAYIIANALEYQIMRFNASSKKQRGIEFVEEELAHVSRSGASDLIIFLDEADQLTPAAQSALKGIIEGATCYFILTCNELHKVSPWLQSRCQVREFKVHGHDDITTNLQLIASREGLLDAPAFIFDRIAEKHSGDMRNAVNALQAYSCLPPDKREGFVNTLSVPALDTQKVLRLCFKEKSIYEAHNLLSSVGSAQQAVRSVFREAVNSQAKPESVVRVIDAAITTERDLINGVDEQIALYNFVRLMIG